MKAKITTSFQGKHDGKIVEILQWVFNGSYSGVNAVIVVDGKFALKAMHELKPFLED